jgi:hypothetical protein
MCAEWKCLPPNFRTPPRRPPPKIDTGSASAGELARALLLGLKQARVLDRNHRLVGEGRNQLNMFGGERTRERAHQDDDADGSSFAQYRNAQNRVEAADLLFRRSGRRKVSQWASQWIATLFRRSGPENLRIGQQLDLPSRTAESAISHLTIDAAHLLEDPGQTVEVSNRRASSGQPSAAFRLQAARATVWQMLPLLRPSWFTAGCGGAHRARPEYPH